MQTKWIYSIIIALIIFGGLFYFLGTNKITNPGLTNTSDQMAQSNTYAPTDTAAGVDITELSTEANQSAALSTKDGTSDMQAVSSDSQNISSSLDSVNNPIP